MVKAVRVRRAPRASVTSGKITAVIEVSAELVGGNITKEQFVEWLKTSIQDYHRWRVGWVGLAMHCSLKPPEVKLYEPGEDS